LLDKENEFPWFDLAGIQRETILAWIGAGCKISQKFKNGWKMKQNYKKKYISEYELKTKPPEKKAPIDPDLGLEY